MQPTEARAEDGASQPHGGTGSPVEYPVRNRNRWVRSLAMFCIFAVIGAAGLYRPPQAAEYPATLRAMFDRLEAHRESVDLIFIGSSYTAYHIRPEAFLEGVGGQVPDVDPEIVALPGMGNFEADAVLDLILEMKLPKLKWVAIEYGAWTTEIEAAKFDSMRGIWWQSPARTSRLIRAIVAQARDKRHLRRAIVPSIAALSRLALNYSRVGKSSAEPPPAEADNRKEQFARLAAQQDSPLFRKQILKAIAKQGERSRRVPLWKPDDKGPVEVFSARAFREQIEKVRAAHAEALYIVPPSLIKKSVKPPAPVFDFDQPFLYPDFFHPEERLDKSHLNDEASERYSRKLGEAFATWVNAGQTPREPSPEKNGTDAGTGSLL